MSQNIYCGRGRNVAYTDFMDLINESFGFHEPEQNFLYLLPKCYREEYRPQDSNYVVIDEDGALTTAVGAYDHELVVCGRRIPCRGIGNVGVHPDHRNKGYMKMAMDQSLADMIADGIALSTLGGRRQRYQYFGYDKAGPFYSFEVSSQNARHALKDYGQGYTVREITDPADPVIDEIMALNAAQPVNPVRPRDRYLDIANSWHARLLVIARSERFVGYCIGNHYSSVSELQIVRDEDIMDVLKALYDFYNGAYHIGLPPHQAAYIHALEPIAESLNLGIAMHFNILNYRLVTEAFLALKQTYTDLPDGEMTLLIHGYAGDERIRVAIQNGIPSAEYIPDTTPVDYELTHLEAIAFLFSPFSPVRDCASALARQWLPLPICMNRADEV